VNEFVAELEELFGMAIPGEEMARITTPSQLAVTARLSGGKSPAVA